MADGFARAGARVWITDVNRETLRDLPEGWRATQKDASDEAAVAALFREIGEVWGGLDVLCANAGTKGPTARVADIALEDWRACLAVCLDGAFLAAKYASPIMERQKSGAVIFTSSTAGAYGYPNRAPYAAAKWGMHGLMKTVAMELGPFGVRANAILPGSVEGPRMEAVLEAEAKAKGMTRDQVYDGYAKGTSMQSFVEAKDIANMAVFLASDAARFVSGQMIAVDGHTVNPDPQV